MQERGQADYRNLGVPGQVMYRAVEDLARQLGRDTGGNFMDRQAPFVKAETTKWAKVVREANIPSQ